VRLQARRQTPLESGLDTAVNSYTRAASNLAADSNSSAAADTAATPLESALNTAVNSYSRAASDAAVAPSSSAGNQMLSRGFLSEALQDRGVDSSSDAALEDE